LESEDGEAYAKRKLKEKNFDMIALNFAGREDYGIKSEFNQVKLFFENGSEEEIPVMPKKELAKHMMNACISLMK
jgi:phosphopantothenoylcysteine decarboxylase/phosphopantothenate--cysteine ligase